ncbi:MAG TPA: hypothetical protein VGU90_11425 [Terriglobales bacterium]|nr:hypothetical protein [Terriglobales bacterium]
MRARQWMLLVVMVASLGTQGCRYSVDDSQSLTLEQRTTIEDSVRRFSVAVAQDVTQQGPVAWRKHFAGSPAFFMAVNGKLVFPSGQAAAAAIPDIAYQFKRIELRWGDDLRLDALTKNLCMVATSYTEVVELRPGIQGIHGTQSGYFTGLAENHNGQWQFRDAHWSAPMLPAKVP